MSTFKKGPNQAALDHEDAWLNVEKPFVILQEGQENQFSNKITEQTSSVKEKTDEVELLGPSFEKYQHEGSEKGGKY